MFILKLFALALTCFELLPPHFAIEGSMDIASFNLTSYQRYQSHGSALEALLLNRLGIILCNLDVKSIYVCFDNDKIATNMVNEVIAKVANCSSVAITLLRYTFQIHIHVQCACVQATKTKTKKKLSGNNFSYLVSKHLTLSTKCSVQCALCVPCMCALRVARMNLSLLYLFLFSFAAIHQ